MALPAGRLDIPRRQDRLLPRQRTAVGFLDRCRRPLPTVTHHAPELVKCVRNCRMPAEWLGADIGKTRLLQPNVAGGASIDDSDLRKPYLLDPVVLVKPALQCNRISPARNQRQILFLVVAPFTEVILSGSYREKNQ